MSMKHRLSLIAVATAVVAATLIALQMLPTLPGGGPTEPGTEVDDRLSTEHADAGVSRAATPHAAPQLVGRPQSDAREGTPDVLEAPMPMLLEKLWKARASLTHLGLDPAKLSDELLTDQVRALIRSDLQDWQLLLTGFVVSLESGDTGDLADLADDEVQELAHWMYWVLHMCGGYAPSHELREASRKALRALRASPPVLKSWPLLEGPLVQMQRDLNSSITLEEAKELVHASELSAREVAQILRAHPAEGFSSVELEEMILRKVDGGFVPRGEAIQELIRRGDLTPSMQVALDDAMLQRGREGRLNPGKVGQYVMPYLRATGRGSWELARPWLDRCEADGQVSLAAALLPHFDPRPPSYEVQRVLDSIRSDDALPAKIEKRIRQTFGLE